MQNHTLLTLLAFLVFSTSSIAQPVDPFAWASTEGFELFGSWNKDEEYWPESIALDNEKLGFIESSTAEQRSRVKRIKLQPHSDTNLDSAFRTLLLFPKLEALHIMDYPIFSTLAKQGESRPFGNSLPLLRNIRFLVLEKCDTYDLNEILRQAKLLPRLTHLKIPLRRSESWPNALFALSNLEAISFSTNQAKDFPPDALTKALPKIKYVELITTMGSNEAHWNRFLRQWPKLQGLSIPYGSLSHPDSLLDKISNLESLHTLKLKCNNWSGFWHAAQALPKLSYLNLEGAQNLQLPDTFKADLPLKTLLLRSCLLKYIATNFNPLQQLQHLDLTHNNLLAFPPGLKHCKKLSYLNASVNDIHTIEDDFFTSLKSLKYLNLGSNKLEGSLPASIIHSRQLEQLIIGGNKLSVWPEPWEMTKLTALDAGTNRFTQLPAAIDKSRQLRSIFLAGNPITKFPAELYELRHLEEISLGYTYISQLPEGKIQWQKLKKFTITHPPTVEKLNESLVSISNKKFLLPKDFEKINTLQEVTITHLPNADGTQVLSALMKNASPYRRMELSGINITQIPDSGWNRSMFKLILLRNNKIVSLPTGMMFLPSKTQLDISDNPLAPGLRRLHNGGVALALAMMDAGILLDSTAVEVLPGFCEAIIAKGNSAFFSRSADRLISAYAWAQKVCPPAKFESLADPGYYGQALFQKARYHEAIVLLEKAIHNGLASRVTITNFMEPNFHYLIQCLLITGDTVKARETSKSWLRYQKSPAAYSMAIQTGLLSGLAKDSLSMLIPEAVKSYEGLSTRVLSRLSELELCIMAGQQDSIAALTRKLDTIRKTPAESWLYRYLLEVNKLQLSKNDPGTINSFVTGLKTEKPAQVGWSYDLLDLWMKRFMDAAAYQKFEEITKAMKNKYSGTATQQ